MIKSIFTGSTVYGEKCPKDWVNFNDEKCFKYHNFNDGINYNISYNICRYYYNGSMVSIHSDGEQTFLSVHLFHDLKANAGIWLGTRRNAMTDQYSWTDGSPFDYTNWASGVSNSTNECVAMSDRSTTVGLWFNVPCDNLYLLICQRKASNHVNEDDLSSIQSFLVEPSHEFYETNTMKSLLDELKSVKTSLKALIYVVIILFIIALLPHIIYKVKQYFQMRPRQFTNPAIAMHM